VKSTSGLRTCSRFQILNASVERVGCPHFAELTRSKDTKGMAKLVLLTLMQWKLSKSVFKSL
jgi:hypothetical protein